MSYQDNALVGSWQVTVTFTQAPPARSLGTFGADGTLITSPPPVLPRPGAPGEVVFASSGHGAWDATGPDAAEGSAGLCIGGDVQDYGALGCAAHPAVADADHVADALFEELARQREVGHLGHAGVAPRAAAAQHQHRVGVDVEVGVVDAGGEVLDRVEDDGPAAVAQQVR